MEERKPKIKLLTNQQIKLQIKSCRSISLPFRASSSKDLKSKPSPLVEQFLEGAKGLPTFFLIEEYVPRWKKGWLLFIRAPSVEAADDSAIPTVEQQGS